MSKSNTKIKQKVWMHKKTGALALTYPVFGEFFADEIETNEPKKLWDIYKVSCYFQIGYGFENQYGCHFLLPKNIEKQFEDIGEF